MHAWRLTLAGTVILLLAASAIGCDGFVPQEDWDIETVYLPAVYVSGETSGGTDGNDRGLTFEWVASDPRLSGNVTTRARGRTFPPDFEAYGGAPPAVFVTARTYEVVNDGGRWVGTATGLDMTEPEDIVMDTVMLSGEGDYDGLTAYLLVDGDPNWDAPTFSGLLFPGPMPSPPAVPAG
jgi:hypothetical protein